MSADSGVTVRDVQLELSDVKGVLPTELVDYHLSNAESAILPAAASWATQADIRDAVALEAAYRLVVRNKDAYLRMREAAELRKDWEADSYVENLKEDRDEAVADVTGDSGPRLRTIGGRTHPDDHTHY